MRCACVSPACRLDYFFLLPHVRLNILRAKRSSLLSTTVSRCSFSATIGLLKQDNFLKNTSCLHQPRHLFPPNAFKNTAPDARANRPSKSFNFCTTRGPGRPDVQRHASVLFASHNHNLFVCRCCTSLYSQPPQGGCMRLYLKHDAGECLTMTRIVARSFLACCCRCACATAAALRCHHFNTCVSSGSAVLSLGTGRFHDCRKAWNATPRVRRRRLHLSSKIKM